MEISFTALLLGFTAGLNLWIGFHVYRRGPQAAQNRAFGFMAITIGLWTTSVALAHYSSVGHVWAVRLAFASAGLIPLGVLAFIECLPGGSITHIRIRSWLLTPIGWTLSALSFSPWIVVSVIPKSSGSGAVYGPLHPVFAAYVALCFGYCIWRLASKYRASSGLLKLQIRYLALAFGIPSGLATTTVVP